MPFVLRVEARIVLAGALSNSVDNRRLRKEIGATRGFSIETNKLGVVHSVDNRGRF